MSKELRDILERVRASKPSDQLVLATVVSLEGSGYRLPGARMLIDRNGTAIGTVSGGCLEADLVERAQQVFATREPVVITYDTRGKDDSVFSLNMGCNGVLQILLEPVEGNDLFAVIESVFSTRRSIAIATVIKSEDPKRPIGRRTILNACSEKAPDSLASQDVFVETIRPPFNLVVFGAGFDAVPVVQLAKGLGWYVTVIDHRPAYANVERLGYPDELLTFRPDELGQNLDLGTDAAVVLMTHNYEHDREVLKFTTTRDVAYIGALGPKRRTEQLLADLAAEGHAVNEETIAKLHAPIGLDIGAQTPETIALSIIAEIQATIAGRDAGFLKDRNAPIYDREKDLPILAAGESGRLGTPKQLIEIEGGTLIRRLASRASTSNAVEVVVVLGHESERIEAQIDDIKNVSAIYNPDHRRGIGTSIRTGIRELIKHDAILISVCDQPHLTTEIFDKLMDALAASAAGIVACRYSETLGVPAIFAKKHFPSLLALPDDAGAKSLLTNDVDAVDFPLGAVDIDTSNDLADL
jgi:xanthine dehydrogenase accessory factor